MAENSKNMHRHGTGGIIFASILLICIALISLIITFSALSRDDEPDRKHPDTTQNDESDDDDNENNDNTNPDNGEDGGGSDEGNDTPKNTTVDKKNEAVYRGPLIQINADHPYNRPEEEIISPAQMEALSPGEVLTKYDFINIATRSDGYFKPRIRRFFLNSDAADAFYAMMKAYNEETGISYIQLTYAYVNEGLYSIKSTGLSVDINIYDNGKNYPLKNFYPQYPTAQHYGWFVSNCHKYGFIHVQDTSSYSTFRYIGVPHATYMKNNNLSFDSYLELVRTKTADDRLVMTDANGNEWWVYYVKASEGDTTSIKIFGNKYSISGDNSGGFIVAIDTSGI